MPLTQFNKNGLLSTKIVFFTVYDSLDALAPVRLVGVDAFVPKSAAGAELIPTLKRVLSS
jgi:DNA-binding NarL/FixJ family response regulator